MAKFLTGPSIRHEGEEYAIDREVLHGENQLHYLGYLMLMNNLYMAQQTDSEELSRKAYIYHNGPEAGIECLGAVKRKDERQ
jgi:hypothetical protein